VQLNSITGKHTRISQASGRINARLARRDEMISEKQVAGFLDGDGCIGIYRVKRRRSASWHYVLNVVFAQSRIDKMKILTEIQLKYGGYLIKIKKKKGCQQAWALRLTGLSAFELIKDVVEFLIVRRKQAELAIKFMEYRIENNGQKYGSKKLPEIHSFFYGECKEKMNYFNRRG